MQSRVLFRGLSGDLRAGARHLIQSLVVMFFAVAAAPARADIVPHFCKLWGAPTWMPTPFAAAEANGRASNTPACNAGGWMCTPVTFSSTGGKNFQLYDCTNSMGCVIQVTGSYYSGGAYFGNDLHCADSTDKRKNAGDPPCPSCAKGHPINGGVGNKFLSETDIPPGNGPGFVRTYNSFLDGDFSVLGMKWRHNWDRSIHAIPTRATVLRGDGKAILFTLPGSGSVWPPASADVVERLEKLTSGWQYTTANEEVEIYDSAGRLTSVTSVSGETTTSPSRTAPGRRATASM